MNELTPEEKFAELKEKGNKSFKREHFKKALEYYTQAIEIKDNESVAYTNRAACNLLLKNYFEVVDDCSKALELDPDNFKAYYRRGLAYLELSNLRLARKDLEKADEMVEQAHVVGPHLKRIAKLLSENERLELKSVDKSEKHRSKKPLQTFKLNNQYSGTKTYSREKS